jgi:DNA-binding LacI/PurR family transcriptional regulator
MQKDFSAHDWARLICNLSSELQRHNYALTMLHADGSDSMDRQMKNFLMSGIADGYVTGPSMLGNEVFALLKKLDVPLWAVCSVHNKLDSVNCIIRDDIPSMTEIWKLIPEEHRSKSAFFAHNNPNNFPRFSDIERAAKIVYPEKDYHIKKIFFNRPSTFSAMEYRDAFKAANENIEQLKEHKIIWCESDFVAQALCDVLQMHNINVGKDIHVIGYGDFETYTKSSDEPVLSTISADTEQNGITLGQAIIAEIDGNTINQPIVNTKFIQRKTFTF